MSRKPRVQRTPEEKWQIVLEGLKSGNLAETCRKYEIAPNLYYRWKDEVKREPRLRLGGKRSPMPSRRNGSNNWSGRWVDPICRSRS
jgi:transposase-like protein